MLSHSQFCRQKRLNFIVCDQEQAPSKDAILRNLSSTIRVNFCSRQIRDASDQNTQLAAALSEAREVLNTAYFSGDQQAITEAEESCQSIEAAAEAMEEHANSLSEAMTKAVTLQKTNHTIAKVAPHCVVRLQVIYRRQ